MKEYDVYRFSSIIRDIKKYDPPDVMQRKKVLDLGCHDGSFARLLNNKGYEVSGIDVWDPRLKKEKTWRYVSYDLDEGNIPFNRLEFDIVTALEIIEHIVDTDKLLSEIHRVLKPDGIFAISTPNICMLKNRIRVALGFYPYGLEYHNVIHHVRLYNGDSLRKHLEENHFKILMLRGERMLPQSMLINDVAKNTSEVLAKIFPTFCSNLVVICKKI